MIKNSEASIAGDFLDLWKQISTLQINNYYVKQGQVKFKLCNMGRKTPVCDLNYFTATM